MLFSVTSSTLVAAISSAMVPASGALEAMYFSATCGSAGQVPRTGSRKVILTFRIFSMMVSFQCSALFFSSLMA